MIIPHEKLSPEALKGLIEEFVTRPGTDTGYTKKTLEQNVNMIMKQLKLGDVVIVYDEDSRTANLVHKDWLKK
jgi:uncharacterized protein YheU (UPF0270 family)